MRSSFFVGCLLLSACSSAAPESQAPPLSDATSLECPAPGLLPFRLASIGYQRSDNAGFAENNPRNKDVAADALGNPGGTSANVYLANDASPSAGLAPYEGRIARTSLTGGLTSTPLPGEYVSLWHYDEANAEWLSWGRTQTDEDGYYQIPATESPAVGSPVYALLEADGSCTKQYDYLIERGAKVILTDIDGTLTTSDDEFYKQLSDESYMPKTMIGAKDLMEAWAAKGYPIIYLTARPHVFRAETRRWLDQLGFPTGAAVTSSALLASDSATTAYKSAWVRRMVSDFGWEITAAYGNATTDIEAYAAGDIPKDRTFIIGPNAGAMETVPIADGDYTSHIASFVDAAPSSD